MCGNASEPQFGQVTVCTADAFQLARRECVLAREVLYLGSAIIFLYFVQSIELKRSVYYSKRRTFSLKCSKNQPKRSHGLQRARYETRVGSPPDFQLKRVPAPSCFRVFQLAQVALLTLPTPQNECR